MSYIRYILIVLIILPLSTWAQIDSADLAITKCQAGEVALAKEIVDKVVTSTTYNKEARTFYYQAFIYKELAKQNGTDAWDLRKKAVTSLDEVTILDKDKEYTDEVNKLLNHLLSLFFNESISKVTAENFNNKLELFDVYASNFNKLDPNFNKTQKEIAFLLSATTSLTQEYNNDWKKNSALVDKIEEIYNRVLKLDENNYTANYNMGMLFYNHAVHIINDMDYDIDLIALNDIEDKTIALFKKALPFEHKADTIMPNRKETLMALQGIYFSLNDFDKSNFYKEQLDKLNK